MATPSGTTVIVHRTRLKLGLSIEQYALMDAIHQLMVAKKKATFFSLSALLAITVDEVIRIVTALAIDDRISMNGEEILCDDRWNREFDINADFDNPPPKDGPPPVGYEPGFWQIWQKRGNKQEALKKYIAARKIVDKETLHRAAANRVATATEWQHIPHAKTWLDPKKRSWEDINDKQKDQGNQPQFDAHGIRITQ